MESARSTQIKKDASGGDDLHHNFKVMRAALLGLIVAPLALLGAGHEASAYPFYGQTESVTCAAAGNDRMLLAALGCPTTRYVPTDQGAYITVSGPSESVMCAAAGNDRMLRAVLRCPMY